MDDINELLKQVDSHINAAEAAHVGERSTLSGIGAGLGRGAYGIANSAIGIRNALGPILTIKGRLRQAEGTFHKDSIEVPGSLAPSKSVTEKTFQPSSAKWWIERGSEMVPQLAAQLGLGAASGGVGSFAATGGALAAGGTYQEAYQRLKKRGMSDDRARGTALAESTLVGVATTALEAIPGAHYLNKSKVGQKYFESTLKNKIASMGVGATKEGLTEVAQEAVADSVRYVIEKDPEAFDDAMDRYLASMSLGAAAGGGVDVAINSARSFKQKSPEAADLLSEAETPTRKQWKEAGLPPEEGRTKQQRKEFADSLRKLTDDEMQVVKERDLAAALNPQQQEVSPADQEPPFTPTHVTQGGYELDDTPPEAPVELPEGHNIDEEFDNQPLAFGPNLDRLGLDQESRTKAVAKAKTYFQEKMAFGHLPRDARLAQEQGVGRRKEAETQAEFLVNDLFSALKKQNKGLQITPDQLEAIDRGVHGEELGESFSPEVTSSVNSMREMINSLQGELHERQLLTDEQFEESEGQWVHRSYRVHDMKEQWVENVPTRIREHAIAYLRDHDPRMTRDEAATQVQSILESAIDNPIMAWRRVAPQGILKKRKDIPEPIRQLLGEYKEGPVNFLKSIKKAKALVEIDRVHEEIKSALVSSGLGQTQPLEGLSKVADEGEAGFRQFENFYTTPEIRQELRSFETANVAGVAEKIVGGYLAGAKLAVTAGSAPGALRNLYSATYSVLSNVGRPIELANQISSSFNAALSSIKHSTTKKPVSKKNRKRLSELIRQGVFDESVDIGTIKAMAEDWSQGLDTYLESNIRTIARLGKGTLKGLMNFYASMDNFAKALRYFTEKETLRAAKPHMPESELQKRAGDIVRSGEPTYSRLPRGVRTLRGSKIFAPFIAFPAAQIQSLVGNTKLAWSEMQDPDLRANGIRRAASMVAIGVAVPYMLTQVTKQMFGITDEEEEDVRRLSAPWDKNATLIFTGRDEDGNINHISLGSVDPYSHLRSTGTALLRGEPAEALKEFADPAISLELGTKKAAEALFGFKLDTGTKIDRPILHALSALEPGTLKAIRKNYEHISGREVTSSNFNEFMRWFGARNVSNDPVRSVRFRAKDFAGKLRDAQNRTRRVLVNKGAIGDGEISEARDATQQDIRKALQEVHEDAMAAIRLSNRGKVLNALKEELPDKWAHAVLANRLLPYRPSKATIRGMERNREERLKELFSP